MKRTTKTDGKIQWKKIGGGSLRFGNKIIKPGQEFWAFEEEIPLAFRDVIKPLSDLPKTKVEKVEAKPLEFTLKRRSETSPWWDIIDLNGKKVNEKALRLEEANKRIDELTKA